MYRYLGHHLPFTCPPLHQVGTRAIIVFNGVFALCMLASLISYCLATYRDVDSDDNAAVADDADKPEYDAR